MIKNILVIRNDRFGEFLLNILALQALKGKYPQARLSVAVDSAVCELAAAVECVDQVLVWDKIKSNLRKYKFDLGVVLNPTKEAHWAVFWAGIPIRVGYDRKWGILLTHKIKDTKHLGNRHEVDCNLELVGLISKQRQSPAETVSAPVSVVALNIPYSDKYKFLAGAIAIHPFTSDLVKQWPVEWFVELAQRITQEMKVKVVLVGQVTDGDSFLRKQSPSVRRQSPAETVSKDIVDLINKTSLVELAAVLKRCCLLISCDSGPMHLAAAVGTPVVALFRNDLLGKTAKRWGPWGEGHTVIEKSSLNDISVEEVLNVVKDKLRGQSPSGTVPSVPSERTKI